LETWRFLAIVATPSGFGSCDGAGETGFGSADGKADKQFARLIAQGASVSAACRAVGVNRKTGTRWRYGRSITSASGRTLHYPAVINARPKVISARYLSEDERIRIGDLHRQGLGVRAIASEVDRSPATVSRELRRNADPGSGSRQDDAGRLRPPVAGLR
jgi:transposase